MIDYRELRIELYEPWYYGRTDRPRITSAPSSIYPGQSFSITSATAVSKVALVRLGSVTHSFNFDQRHIWLQTSASPSLFPPEGGVRIRATAPPNNFVAPPGYYMLFVLNSAGVPSKAKIIKVEENSSIQRVTSANLSRHFMNIDDPLSNNTPDANILVTPNWNPPRSPESPVWSPNPIGVWFNSSVGKWSIFDETFAAMEVGGAFNVKIEPPSINATQGAPKRHIATAANTRWNFTDIDDPELNNNPNAVVIVTHNWSPPGGPNIYNPHNIGVWFNWSTGKWSIFNEDKASMKVGLAFNYRVGGKAFVHTATAGSIEYGISTYLEHPDLKGRPNAAILVTHNWNPGGSGQIYNDSALGVWYDTLQKRWAIFNQRDKGRNNRLGMQEGTAFNVLILN